MRLPKTLVYAGLIIAFVIGQILIWNDKRVNRSRLLSAESMGSEKLA